MRYVAVANREPCFRGWFYEARKYYNAGFATSPIDYCICLNFSGIYCKELPSYIISTSPSHLKKKKGRRREKVLAFTVPTSARTFPKPPCCYYCPTVFFFPQTKMDEGFACPAEAGGGYYSSKAASGEGSGGEEPGSLPLRLRVGCRLLRVDDACAGCTATFIRLCLLTAILTVQLSSRCCAIVWSRTSAGVWTRVLLL